MSYVDRRREERYGVDLNCTVGPSRIPMKVCDVSLSGLGITGSAILYQLHQVEVEIDVHIGFSNHILLRGVVRDVIPCNGYTRYCLEIFDTPNKWIKYVLNNASKKGERVLA